MTRAAAPMRAIVALALAAALAPLTAAQTAGCSLQLGPGAAPVSFDRCLTIDGVGDGFVLYWSQGTNSVTWGMSTSSSSGYVAVRFGAGQLAAAGAGALPAVPQQSPGPCPLSPSPCTMQFAFPESPGQMVGANAFSLQACGSCATGEAPEPLPTPSLRALRLCWRCADHWALSPHTTRSACSHLPSPVPPCRRGAAPMVPWRNGQRPDAAG